MKLLLIALVLTICFVPAIARGQSMIITENGVPKAVIVIPSGTLPAPVDPKAPKPRPGSAPSKPDALLAAEELQSYIEKISGAKLPIVEESSPQAASGTRIFVGRTNAIKAAGLKVPSGYDPSVRPDVFNEEGYVLRTKGDQIFIAGNEDGPYQGSLYAAYALLEKLGVRWYFPGSWGEVVPEQKSITLAPIDVTVKPDFPVRVIWLSGWVPQTPDDRKQYAQWATRVGMSSSTLYPSVGDGSLAGLLPPEEYYEKNPEYFGMNEQGQRFASKNANGKFVTHTTMLCLSNPSVFDESLKNVKAALAGERKLMVASPNGIGISPPDGAPVCLCPECKKLSQNFQYPTYVHKPATSEEFFTFASKLARAIPDKYVSTMAYALREFLPQGVDIPDNVMVMYAPIANDVLHPHTSPLWRHVEFVSMLKQYLRQTPHVTLYDYNPGMLTGSWVPERDAENMAINAPLYKSLGLKGFNREGRKAFMQTWLSYYVSSRLFWNANADVEAIKKEFYTTFFSPSAGPHVQAWWDACAARLNDNEFQAHEDWVINHIYSMQFVQSLAKHVEAAKAASASATPAQRQRLEAFYLIADHLLGYAQVNEAEKSLDYAAASAAAARMTENKEKLNAISSFLISVEKPAAGRRPKHFFSEGRKLKFDELLAMTNGSKGTLLAPLPLEMKFTRDKFNQGVPMQWYAPDFDDSKWGSVNTFYLWDQQQPFETPQGHDYDGYGWYRGTINLDASVAGKPVRFWCGGISNEGWVWINGKYAGRKSHALWWAHPHDFELDVTSLIKPGSTNTITIRVLSDSELGGVYRRGFFYSPIVKP
jgi:hypothetical protein